MRLVGLIGNKLPQNLYCLLAMIFCRQFCFYSKVFQKTFCKTFYWERVNVAIAFDACISTVTSKFCRGVELFDDKGNRYLDFVAGIATNCLGHASPILVDALTKQANKLWHVSNSYQTELQKTLAEKWTSVTFADVVFFTNSGTEAIEACLKTARKYHFEKGKPEKIDIIGFDGAFHGRSYGGINAAANPNYLHGFGPALPGFKQCKFGDLDALKAMIDEKTAGIILEPIQGEGGCRAATDEYLKGIRELCDANDILLIYDEVQSGAGRSGKLFAHEWSGVTPDIMAAAKGIGGGFPMGACLATEKAAVGMVKGVHGSTFGGGVWRNHQA